MKNFLAGLFLIGIIFLASEINAQSVNGSIGAIKRGGSARGSVSLTIPGGQHTNSNRPGGEYSIPTVLSVTAPGAKISGITYPRGVNRSYSYSDGPINVYEGTVRFGFTVSVPAGFKGNSIKIRAVVRYQACTDSVCYPPKSKEVTLTAAVK